MTQPKAPNNLKWVKHLKRTLRSHRITNFKKNLGHIAREPAFYKGIPIVVRGNNVCNHDLYHLEVSCLERIRMGEHEVSGIHGIILQTARA